MESKIKVLVAVAEPLLADGIVNAIMATDDLEVVAKPNDRKQATTAIHELQLCAACVAIIDFDLFGPNVFKTIKDIKQDCENLAILALVNRMTPSCLLQSLQVGIAGCLPKTATSIEVINAIHGVCAGKAIFDLPVIREFVQHLNHAVDEEGQRLGWRELEVLKLASKGLSNKKIAQRLFISERTVQSHLTNIFGKLRVASRTEAVLTAWRNGLITDEDLTE